MEQIHKEFDRLKKLIDEYQTNIQGSLRVLGARITECGMPRACNRFPKDLFMVLDRIWSSGRYLYIDHYDGDTLLIREEPPSTPGYLARFTGLLDNQYYLAMNPDFKLSAEEREILSQYHLEVL